MLVSLYGVNTPVEELMPDQYDIVSVYEAKEYLGLELDVHDDDQLLLRLTRSATAALEGYLRNNIVSRSATDSFLGYQRTWFLSRYPVASITSIVDAAANALTTDDYILIPETGMVHSRVGVFPQGVDSSGLTSRWTVTYTAGRFATAADVTPDFRLAILILTAERYNRREPNMQFVASGGTQTAYSTFSMSSRPVVHGLPDEVVALVGRYVSRAMF